MRLAEFFARLCARFFVGPVAGRDANDADEEPTAPLQPVAAAAPIARPAAERATGTGKARVIDPQREGFDPYNSGSFERRNAWERIGRR